jgi:outer membrane protein assembly factor BamB
MLKKITTMFIAFALLISLSGVGSAEAINNSCDCSSWLTYMGDYGRTSSSNCDIDPLSPHFREIWKSEKIGPSIIGDQPLIYDGKLITSSTPYLFSDGEEYKYAKKNTAKLVCMDANSGNIMWSNPLSGWGSVATGSIDTENNTIIIGSGHDPSTKYEKNEMETGVFCVDINSGEDIWTYISPYGIGTCGAIADNNYYVGTHRALFICLDAKNGNLKWSTKPKNKIGFYMPLSTACYLYNSLFSCSYDGTLTSYNKDDGTQSWAKDLNFFDFQMITPSVWNEKLIVPTSRGEVLLFDSKGNEIWSCQVENLSKYEEISSATVYNDKIFIVTNPVEENNDGRKFYGDSVLYSIDANDGTVLDSKTLEYHISHGVSTPIIIFFNAHFDHVDIFSTDDLELLSSITPEDGLISTPLSICEDKLYFGLHTGEMVCYGVSPIHPAKA